MTNAKNFDTEFPLFCVVVIITYIAPLRLLILETGDLNQNQKAAALRYNGFLKSKQLSC